MGKPGNTGLTRIIKAFGYSMKGLRAAWRHESAFRQETVLAVLLLPAAFCLGSDPLRIALLVGPLFIVVIVELVNSAIEAAVDRIGEEAHKLSGRAKDLGSAAVFLALALVVIVWGLIAIERFDPALLR
jgi:diacylglycerol kinase (ATP)